jgi:integrase
MHKARKKKRAPQRVLALPDLEQSKAAVLNSLTSKSGQRTYDRAITDFVAWYCCEPRLALNRTVVLRYRIHFEQKQYAPTTINLHLAAVRWVAFEAADSGLLSPELAAGIRRVKGMRRIGVRVGNWLTAEQGKRLLASMKRESLRGKRNYAMLAMLIGCGLRRGELLTLRADSIQSAGRPLGRRRSGGQRRARSYHSHSVVGKGSDRRMEGRQRDQGRSSVSFDQKARPDLGQRNDCESVMGDSAGGSLAGRDRDARSSRPPPYLCEALSISRRGIGSNPVSARARLDPDHRALPRMQAEVALRRQRPDRYRAGRGSIGRSSCGSIGCHLPTRLE